MRKFLSFQFFFSLFAAQAQGFDNQTFIEHLKSTPVSLFPLTNIDYSSQKAADFFFEGLAMRHWDTAQWIPLLAQRWEISPNGLEGVFFLNPKATFSNGDPVTAEDVKFSFDVLNWPGVESFAMKPYMEKLDRVEVINSKTVKFFFKETYYKNFETVAGYPIFQKKHYVPLYEKDKTLGMATSTRSPMGTGPWLLESFETNQHIILKRNEKYWDKATHVAQKRWNYNRIIVRTIQEPQVAFEAFKKGDLTFFYPIAPQQWVRQTEGPLFKERLVRVQLENDSPKAYGFIAWNQKNPILANKDVRWALSHLVDLKLWQQKLSFDLDKPAIGPYSPDSPQHDPSLKPVEFNLAEARRRLAQAGWVDFDDQGVLIKDGKRFEITLMYPTQSRAGIEPQLNDFKIQAAKVGIVIHLKSLEWTSFTKLLDEQNFDAATLRWTRSMESDLKPIFHSDSAGKSGSNFVGYKNPNLDKIMEKYQVTLDEKKRTHFAQKIQRTIYEDQPYTFLLQARYELFAHQNYVVKPKKTFGYDIGTQFWRLEAP